MFRLKRISHNISLVASTGFKLHYVKIKTCKEDLKAGLKKIFLKGIELMMKLQDFLIVKDDFIQGAIDFGANCPMKKDALSTDIDSIKNLDELIEILKGLYQKGVMSDEVAWEIAIKLGVLLGEMIINEGNYKWVINEDDLPVVEAVNGNQLSPIIKIYKIIRSNDDSEGKPSDFYYNFIMLNLKTEFWFELRIVFEQQFFSLLIVNNMVEYGKKRYLWIILKFCKKSLQKLNI